MNLYSSYLLESPGADLRDRYGSNSKFEFRLEYLQNNSYSYFIKSGIRIGDNVKEDVLASLRTSEGFVIGVNGYYADVFGRKRGFDIGVGADKLFHILPEHDFKKFLRAGLALSYTSHWVNFVDDSQSVPQLTKPYSQLYDRFVSGPALEENFQFQVNSKKGSSAFLAGIQLVQLWGNEHRYELSSQLSSKKRLDLYFGIKISYLFTIFEFGKGETVYY